MQRVVPFVEDRRNCLLIEPVKQLDPAVLISLEAALKVAVQVAFQVEDNELATELLPDATRPRLLFLYESAEGGAGVLRRLLDDPSAFARVARQALDICHFDPETGEDRRRAERATEDCEAACYDCLMSYTNQPAHGRLDRQRIRDVLLTLVPLLVAGILTLEISVMINLPLNFANIIALPLLLGVGVAFKIYYIMAWRAGQTGLLQSPLTRAVMFSACTTATAFGSLWLSSHPGTSSMGKLMALALVTTMAAAVLFQPVLMGPPRERARVRRQQARQAMAEAKAEGEELGV